MMERVVNFIGATLLTAVLLILIGVASAWASLLPPPHARQIVASNTFFALFCLLFINLLLGLLLSLRDTIRSPWIMAMRLAALLILLGAFIGRQWGYRGYLELYDGQQASCFQGVGGARIEPGFAVKLNSFSVERYPGGPREIVVQLWGEEPVFYPLNIGHWTGPPPLRVRPLRYLPDFRINADGDVTSESDEPNNPALEVEIRSEEVEEKGWLFSRFPHFPPPGLNRTLRTGRVFFVDHGSENVKVYKSEIAIIEGGKEIAVGTSEVNHPFKWGGHRIYQAYYDAVGWQWSGLVIVCDPGLPLVYCGYVLLALGITLWVGLGRFE
jgi:hypothetical protein